MARTFKRKYKPQLDAIIRAIPTEMEREIHAALEKTGNEVTGAIKPRVPKRSGNLQESVDWNYGDPKAGTLGAASVRLDKRLAKVPARLRISVYVGGKGSAHAHLVEHGTEERFTDTGVSRGVSPPQPFFYPVIRAYRRRIKGRLTRAGRKGLEKALK